MALIKEVFYNSIAFISEEDGEYFSNKAKKERFGIIPEKNHNLPGDDPDCIGCPIWIRWACTKCHICMYWLEEEE